MTGHRALAIGCLLSAGLAGSCSQSDSIVVVDVDADPGLSDVMQLRATLSNAGMGDVRSYPQTPATIAMTFPTGFSISVARARTGALDIALDGLGTGGDVVANGAETVTLDPGHTVTLKITLHAGASLCGNGRVDAGEDCDDGDRISSGSCDFRCHAINPGTGGAGGTGGGGAGGTGGDGGRGPAGSAGTAGGGASGAAGTGTAGGGASGAAGTGTAGGGASGAAGTGGAVGGMAGSRAGSGGSTGQGGAGGTAGTGACTVELLTNGNFEAGNTGWTATTSGRALIYRYTDVDPAVAPPAQSLYIAWLGYDVMSETVLLSQQIAVPANARSLIVSGSVSINTDEDLDTPYDFAYVEILTGTSVNPEATWTNMDASDTWTGFAVTHPATGLAGSTATFQLRVLMDDGVNTSFFFDNLSVVANLCP